MKKPWNRFFVNFIMSSVCLVFALNLVLTTSTVFGEEPLSSAGKLRKATVKAIKGKTMYFVPCMIGSPFDNYRVYSAAREAKASGMKFILRDSGADPMKQTQAVSAAISMKPDVLVAQSLTASLLQTLLRKAEEAGIYVVQIQMASNYRTDAFVGVDMYALGRLVAEEICKECGAGSGTSGKVAILQGDITSDACLEETKSMLSYFKDHPEIKVVLNQGVGWDANTAHDIISVVLKQHPDLCALTTDWQGYGLGAAQAVSEAKMSGKVRVYTGCEITPTVAEYIRNGKITAHFYFHPAIQSHDIVTAAKTLLQQGLKPGSLKLTYYTPVEKVTKENLNLFSTWIPSTEMTKKMAKDAGTVVSGEPTYELK